MKFASPDEFNQFGDGFITPDYFQSHIIAADNNTVMHNHTWFIYLFHSLCNIKQCLGLNDAYSKIYTENKNIMNMR